MDKLLTENESNNTYTLFFNNNINKNQDALLNL